MNDDARQEPVAAEKPRCGPNEIACPQCGNEICATCFTHLTPCREHAPAVPVAAKCGYCPHGWSYGLSCAECLSVVPVAAAEVLEHKITDEQAIRALNVWYDGELNLHPSEIEDMKRAIAAALTPPENTKL